MRLLPGLPEVLTLPLWVFFLGQKEIQNLMHLRKGVTIVIKKCIGTVTPEMYSTCEVKTSIIFKSITARQRTNGALIE